ncbi:hypothetical protein [Chromobacterium haemolyticum]|uniref:Uncharacterized protein n=1 Tax=Chromobacterium haemolyticum TaxID=394935 RepID=A0A1W0CG57_9NEIS|nr:hypothetical protein [Chromobacterium haemolyticum]OQS33689.1 hypothetical protein B0T45_20115 [Chromobacterium haemolyticum]
MHKPEYRIYFENGDRAVTTDWPARAQAAWFRITHDWRGAVDGGDAVVEKDGLTIARENVKTGEAKPWPDKHDREIDINDVAASITLLCKYAGIKPADLAQEMTNAGLPTSRSRIETIKATGTRKAGTCPAELVTLIDAAVAILRRQG